MTRSNILSTERTMRSLRKAGALFLSDTASILLFVLLLAVIIEKSICVHNPLPSYTGMAVHSPMTTLRSWFLLISSLAFGVNILCMSLKSSIRLPALMTILGIGAIFFGALVNMVVGLEGVLPLTIGESKDTIITSGGDYRLPFSVFLTGFTVRHDGASVANYESALQLNTGEHVVNGITEVNRPLRFEGYSFYQEAFDPQRPSWTGLKVVRDPSGMFVFPGLLLLNAGIISCIVQYMKNERNKVKKAICT